MCFGEQKKSKEIGRRRKKKEAREKKERKRGKKTKEDKSTLIENEKQNHRKRKDKWKSMCSVIARK